MIRWMALLFVSSQVFAEQSFAADLHADELDSYSTTACSAEWAGACLTAWTSVGDDGSLSMCTAAHQEGGGTDTGVLLSGSDPTFPNAIKYEFDVTAVSDGVATIGIHSWAISSTIEAAVRIQFLNSSGSVLSTTIRTLNPAKTDNAYSQFIVDVSDADVEALRVTVGVRAVGTEVWVNRVDMKYESGGDLPQTEAECIATCTCPPGYRKVVVSGVPNCHVVWSSPPPSCETHPECEPDGNGKKPKRKLSASDLGEF